ncbi:unnamed protein product [Merluccius merluccius]
MRLSVAMHKGGHANKSELSLRCDESGEMMCECYGTASGLPGPPGARGRTQTADLGSGVELLPRLQDVGAQPSRIDGWLGGLGVRQTGVGVEEVRQGGTEEEEVRQEGVGVEEVRQGGTEEEVRQGVTEEEVRQEGGGSGGAAPVWTLISQEKKK